MARHLLSMRDLTRAGITELFQSADGMHPGGARSRVCSAGLFFFQESMRTRVGFECAVGALGGRAVNVAGPKFNASMSEPESWEDVIRAVGSYFDVICVRHSDPVAAAVAIEVLPDTAVINCGNGGGEHPTQALIDLYAITKHRDRAPDGIRVVLVGDLLGMRAAHSLVLGLARYEDVTITAVSPTQLALPEALVAEYVASGNRFQATDSLASIGGADVVYVAGFPPRTGGQEWSDEARSAFRITPELAGSLGPDAAILCPLPRIDEIDRKVDSLPQARYFWQSELGLSLRMAILTRALGE